MESRARMISRRAATASEPDAKLAAAAGPCQSTPTASPATTLTPMPSQDAVEAFFIGAALQLLVSAASPGAALPSNGKLRRRLEAVFTRDFLHSIHYEQLKERLWRLQESNQHPRSLLAKDLSNAWLQAHIFSPTILRRRRFTSAVKTPASRYFAYLSPPLIALHPVIARNRLAVRQKGRHALHTGRSLYNLSFQYTQRRQVSKHFAKLVSNYLTYLLSQHTPELFVRWKSAHSSPPALSRTVPFTDPQKLQMNSKDPSETKMLRVAATQDDGGRKEEVEDDDDVAGGGGDQYPPGTEGSAIAATDLPTVHPVPAKKSSKIRRSQDSYFPHFVSRLYTPAASVDACFPAAISKAVQDRSVLLFKSFDQDNHDQVNFRLPCVSLQGVHVPSTMTLEHVAAATARQCNMNIVTLHPVDIINALRLVRISSSRGMARQLRCECFILR